MPSISDDSQRAFSCHINNSNTMEKKNLSGEYLAPKIKVTQAKALQVLCSSVISGTDGNKETYVSATWNW